MLRLSARRRKLAFSLTLTEFRKFCDDTGYLEKRGNKPESLTIDRINHDKGYHLWNIKIETHAKNSINGHTVPGRDTKQNERRPEGEEEHDARETCAEYAQPTADDQPF